MDTFEHIWALLNPQGEYKRRRQACRRLWESFPIERQRQIYAVISRRKTRGEFVNPNPYFAIEDNAEVPVERLTFSEYYARFGTTEEQGGWKMTNPTGNKVIYVRDAG
jgi:hypothetical protein